MTVVHWALLKFARLQTFYGPALVSELGEYPEVLPHTDRFLRAAWFGAEAMGFQPADLWTDEFLDWDEQADLVRPRERRPSEGWVTVREGTAEGPLLGGCLETICWHPKGSVAWLDLAGAVLFLETSEEVPSPAHVDAYLTDLEQLGVFDSVAGLIVGRPYGYDQERARALVRGGEPHARIEHSRPHERRVRACRSDAHVAPRCGRTTGRGGTDVRDDASRNPVG